MESCGPSSPKRLKLSRESLVTCFKNRNAASNTLLAAPQINTSQKVHPTPQSSLQETETVRDDCVMPEDIIYSGFKFGNALKEDFFKENVTLSMASSDMELCVMTSGHWNLRKNLCQEIDSKEQDFLSDMGMPDLFQIRSDMENKIERANIVSGKVSIQDEIRTWRGLPEIGYIATMNEVKSFTKTHILSSLGKVAVTDNTALKHDSLSEVTAVFQERQGGSDEVVHDVHQYTECESDFVVRPWSNSYRKQVFLMKDNVLSPYEDKKKYQLQSKANGAVLDDVSKEHGGILETETEVEKEIKTEMVAVKYKPLEFYDDVLRKYIEADQFKNEDLHFILSEVPWTNAFCTAAEHSLEHAECLTRKKCRTVSHRSVMHIEAITEPCISKVSSRKTQNKPNSSASDLLFFKGCSGKIVEKGYSNDFALSLSRMQIECRNILYRNTTKFSDERQIRTKVRVLDSDMNLSSPSSMNNNDNLHSLPFIERHAKTNSDFPLSLLGNTTTETQKKKCLLDIMYGEVSTTKQHINKDLRKVRQIVEQRYCFRNLIKHNHNSSTDTFYPKATIYIENCFYCIDRANVCFIYAQRQSLKQFSRMLASHRSLISTDSLFNANILNKNYMSYIAFYMGTEFSMTKEIYISNLSFNEFKNSCGIQKSSAAWDDGLGDRNMSKQQRSTRSRAPETLSGSKWLTESTPTINSSERTDVAVPGGDLESVFTLVNNTAIPECSLWEADGHSEQCTERGVQSTGPFTSDSITAFLNMQQASKLEVKCNCLVSHSDSKAVTTYPQCCSSKVEPLKEIIQIPPIQKLHVDNANISLVTECTDFTFTDKSVLHLKSHEEKSSKGAREEKSLNNDLCDITMEKQVVNICYSQGIAKQNIKKGEKSKGTFCAKFQLNTITNAHGSVEQPQDESCILKSAQNVSPTFEVKQKFDLDKPLKDQSWEVPADETDEKEESKQLPDIVGRSAVWASKESPGKGFNFRGRQEPAFDREDMEREQEVPLKCGRRMSEPEHSLYSAGKQKGFQNQDTVDGPKAWVPAFTFHPSFIVHKESLPEQPRKLEPLKTCSRPIRVGLSKKARVKQLHRSVK